ncbi:hypothetical protein AB0F36_01215 [Streptomyces sp. NPDC029080]|uniref:hypothetical protein n=1 Tax=Streptomyces sp. NPDC029080 TaxID=3155017 RepID=UPI0033E0F87F
MSVSGRGAAAAGPDARAEELRRTHCARARSAYDRAVAACRYAGVGPDAAEIVPKDTAGRAAGALRLAARSLDALAVSAPDPAADARCARNTAATAALAAQLAAAVPPDVTGDATATVTGDATTAATVTGGATATLTGGATGDGGRAPHHDSAEHDVPAPDDGPAAAALRAALAASRAAAAAAGGTARGRDTALNAEADEAERRAVTAARAAGWLV